jgi:hypothetical protein
MGPSRSGAGAGDDGEGGGDGDPSTGPETDVRIRGFRGEADGRVRGYVLFRWGEGIGTALLDRGIDRLSEGTDRLKPEGLAGNDVGREFYAQPGSILTLFSSIRTLIIGEKHPILSGSYTNSSAIPDRVTTDN